MANDIDSKNDSNAQNDNPYYKNVLLIGSPNVGKSLTFNKLTGMTAMVSNYPGTTVDIDEGNFTYEEKTVHLTDPPGLYDLNTITEEERVAKLLVLDERFDLMVHVVDAKNIEKSIDLTLQLIDAGKEVILVLNMMDEFEDMGASVDAKGLSSELGIPVVLTAAAENRGLDELKHTIVNYDSIENEILKESNTLLKRKTLFINVSQGIEPETSLRVSEIVEEEIDEKYLKGYVALSGPSHAEEVILRKATALVAASKDLELASFVQKLFSNEKYMRVYTSDDVIGVEAGGAMKNAIAIVSGVASGMGLGENARAMLITRGIKEIVSIVLALGGKMETVYGLSGIGDLIVTASSMNSRNFQCGLKIGRGMSVDMAMGSIVQSVEGVRAIHAGHEIGIKYNLELPIIDEAFKVVEGKLSAKEALHNLLARSLKTEKYW